MASVSTASRISEASIPTMRRSSSYDSSCDMNELLDVSSSSSTVFELDEKLDLISPIQEKRSQLKSRFDLSSSSSPQPDLLQEKRNVLKDNTSTTIANDCRPKPAFGDNREAEKINSVERYQLIVSFSVIVSIFLLEKIPQTHPYFSKFIRLQHKYPNSDKYDIGIDDLFFVITWMFAVTFVRAFSMIFILKPIAISQNIGSHKSVQRFKEQGWYLIYYSISFIFGFSIYYKSEYYFNCDNFYIDWPHDQMDWVFKSYYLIELACWLQQVFILNIEAKRRDYSQMFSHHIITCLLVSGSYYYYFTRIGNVILMMMDVIDIVLSLAKVLKYCGFSTICDVLFGIFMVGWVIIRHGLYNYILYHCATKSRGLLESQSCVPGIVAKRCITDKVIDVFVLLLAGLQGIMLIWMYLIAKVAIKVINGTGADDVRSGDEDED